MNGKYVFFIIFIFLDTSCLVYFVVLFNIVKVHISVFLVGSFVWSHLTNVLRSEDPMKQALIESLPDDIISRDFEAEFLKYSSYSDHTVASGNVTFTVASDEQSSNKD